MFPDGLRLPLLVALTNSSMSQRAPSASLSSLEACLRPSTLRWSYIPSSLPSRVHLLAVDRKARVCCTLAGLRTLGPHGLDRCPVPSSTPLPPCTREGKCTP